jgi:hypothetical protein
MSTSCRIERNWDIHHNKASLYGIILMLMYLNWHYISFLISSYIMYSQAPGPQRAKRALPVQLEAAGVKTLHTYGLGLDSFIPTD